MTVTRSLYNLQPRGPGGGNRGAWRNCIIAIPSTSPIGATDGPDPCFVIRRPWPCFVGRSGQAAASKGPSTE
ncbi:hypothetical protein PVAP13_3KG392200 [Panicum virgatum]|uniref:Uncharacterized protein n=1 Tax=Panicum virgatum TaxID=38727 RepID=A0A8T0V418_PANVG|nr:hypothetical protein PVAP13_3KG392200 [Panicum virgatum]